MSNLYSAKTMGVQFVEQVASAVEFMEIGERIPVELADSAIDHGIYSFQIETVANAINMLEASIKQAIANAREGSLYAEFSDKLDQLDDPNKAHQIFEEGVELGIKREMKMKGEKHPIFFVEFQRQYEADRGMHI